MYRQRRAAARGIPVAWLTCEIVRLRRNSEKARITCRPRASDAMNSGRRHGPSGSAAACRARRRRGDELGGEGIAVAPFEIGSALSDYRPHIRSSPLSSRRSLLTIPPVSRTNVRLSNGPCLGNDPTPASRPKSCRRAVARTARSDRLRRPRAQRPAATVRTRVHVAPGLAGRPRPARPAAFECSVADPQSFECSAIVGRLRGQTVAELRMDAARLTRREAHIDSADSELVQVLWLLAGRCRVRQGPSHSLLTEGGWDPGRSGARVFAPARPGNARAVAQRAAHRLPRLAVGAAGARRRGTGQRRPGPDRGRVAGRDAARGRAARRR